MLELNFNPFPELMSERLLLRRITMHDAADFLKIRSDINAMKYIDRPIATELEDMYKLILKINDGIDQNDAIGWGITLKNENRLIGTIGYHIIEKEHYRAEIGYMLLPSAWKKGYMSEAIQAVIDFGFSKMNLHSIEAKINPDNQASAMLLKKFHFIREAYFKENYFFNGKFLDTAIYSLLHS